MLHKTGLGLSLWPRRTALLVEKEPRGEGPGVQRTGRGVSEEQVLPGRSLFRAEGVPWSQDLTGQRRPGLVFSKRGDRSSGCWGGDGTPSLTGQCHPSKSHLWALHRPGWAKILSST